MHCDKLNQTDYRVIRTDKINNSVVLKDKISGRNELWGEATDDKEYTIEIDGRRYKWVKML